ncbi:hypothetical protein AAC03nite_26580 [Alicyclobacillus acidoterrestris]|nr:hypothetical protein AAC03nite_26580 [Alicyclobacillus acidoterrestris]
MGGREELGAYIKQLLEQNGMSGRDLAEKAGYDPGHISRVINAKVGISPDFLKRIAPHLVGTNYRQLAEAAGLIEDNENAKPQSVDEIEERIGNLIADLTELLEKYTEQRLREEPVQVPLDIDNHAMIHEDTGYRLKNECDAHITWLKALMDSVRELKCADRLGFVHDPEKLSIASSLAQLDYQQLGIIKALISQFTGNEPGGIKK